MLHIFPIAPVFPEPDWIDSPVLPESASIETIFINKARSTLQLSEVMTDAELTVRWEDLNYSQVLRFWQFWSKVETREVFTLPDKWWPETMPAERRVFYQRLCPTGTWRFKEKPTIDDRHADQPFMVATIIGVID